MATEDHTSASLEFMVPRDLADGFINNKRERYKFRLFQKVFDQSVKQEEIFENIAKPVADSVLSGYNGTIFAYGQTGSGKTFTITGGAEHYADRGIIPRTLSYLYECFSQDSSMIYTTHISYLEIYNEMGYDLLDSRHEASRLEDLPKVMIMEDPDQNIHLRNLSLQQSATEEEALNLLFLGDTNRMIAETPMNQASTRSHCIFTVHLCRREPGSATLRRSKLHLVDLAGSDRVSKTGLNGQLLTEAKYINLSLHYLEQVIIALSEKNRSHIPYRNSMLTSMLRDSLGGNCMTTMIATMAVDKRNIDVSLGTPVPFSDTISATMREDICAAEVTKLKEMLTQRDNEITYVSVLGYFLSGPQLSMGKQEAFETFIRDHEDYLTIEDNKNLLKQRTTEAKRLGEQLNESVYSTFLSAPCLPNATVGVIINHTEFEEEVDPVEENLCKHIEQEKKTYKSTIGCLKALKTEIEHLQLLMEKTKVKLQKDFHKWWNQEASSMQVTVRGHSQMSHRVTEWNLAVIFTSYCRIWVIHSFCLLISSSIPLTGDQKADADILAFVNARQNLFNRTGNTKHAGPEVIIV
uniref:Kinesin family member 6 n=1 Tax=Mastacembelus armatus TaxID=205130 RepID=A0A7N8WUX3_9TELE